MWPNLSDEMFYREIGSEENGVYCATRGCLNKDFNIVNVVVFSTFPIKVVTLGCNLLKIVKFHTLVITQLNTAIGSY